MHPDKYVPFAKWFVNRFYPYYKGKDLYDDLVQEACVAILQGLHKHDPEKGSLHTILIFKMRGRLHKFVTKHRKLQAVYTEDITPSSANKIYKEFCDKTSETISENHVRISLLVDKLQDEKDKVIVDLVLKGYTYQEIGDELGITKQGVAFRLKQMGA